MLNQFDENRYSKTKENSKFIEINDIKLIDYQKCEHNEHPTRNSKLIPKSR